MRFPRAPLIAFSLLLTGCSMAGDSGAQPAIPGEPGKGPWAGIGTAETIRFTGTEPFWVGEVANGVLTWKTPEDQAGTAIGVERFAGRNGLGFSGMLAGAPFEMALSDAVCNDGMSDRQYPFTVTVSHRAQVLSGCGWSQTRPFTGSVAP